MRNVLCGGAAGIYGPAQLIDCLFLNNWYHGDVVALGGAICVGQQTEFVRCNFTGNSALQTLNTTGTMVANGGAVFSQSLNVTFRNCSFTRNTAHGGSALYGRTSTTGSAVGGAVYLATVHDLSSSPQFIDCIFDSNVARGGNVRFKLHDADQGSAEASGGAIGVFVTGSTFTGMLHIDNCNFTANQAIGGNTWTAGDAFGGAINANSMSVVAVNTRFHDNRVIGGCSRPEGMGGTARGGAISQEGAKHLNLSNCEFVNNSVIGGSAGNAGDALGGGIFFSGISPPQWDIFLSNLRLLSNQAVGGNGSLWYAGQAAGAAIDVLVTSHGGTFYMENCLVMNNDARGGSCNPCDGGRASAAIAFGQNGLHGMADSATLLNCSVLNNTVTGGRGTSVGGGANGGGLLILAETTQLLAGCVFRYNSARGGRFQSKEGTIGWVLGGGAVISSNENSTLLVSDTHFIRNWIDGGSAPSSCFGHCLTNVHGGALAALSANSTILYSTFIDNRASSDSSLADVKTFGGAVAFRGEALVVGSNFTHNQGLSSNAAKGGAIFTAFPLSIDACRFDNNEVHASSDGNGGAIFSEACTAHFDNVSFSKNFASGSGAGIFVSATAESTHVVARACKWQKGIAKESGGGMHFSVLSMGVTIEVLDSVFESNLAMQGAALTANLSLDSILTIQACNILNNTATQAGGVIFFLNSNPIQHLAVCTHIQDANMLSNNDALAWGPICASPPLLLNTSQVTQLVWPGELLSLVGNVLDEFNNTCLVPEPMTVRQLSPNDTTFASGIPRDSVLSELGYYSFQRALFYEGTKDASNRTLEFSVQSEASQLTATTNFTLLKCPPNYALINTSGNALCSSCASPQISLNGTICSASCPDIGIACLSIAQSNYILSAGYQFSPNIFNATRILACPFVGACPSLNLTIEPDLVTYIWHFVCENCSTEDFTCTDLYSDRLCAKCVCPKNGTNCAYSTDGGCERCSKHMNGTVLALAGLILFVALFILVTFHRHSLILLFAEAAVMTIFLLIGPEDRQWFLEIFLLTALIYFMLNRQTSSGLLKSLLFFLQTAPAIIPNSMWPENWWDLITTKLNAFNVHFWGIECASPKLFSEPGGRYLFYMLLPVIVILLVTLLILMAKGFRVYLIPKLVLWYYLGKALIIRSDQGDSDEPLASDWRDILGDGETRLQFDKMPKAQSEEEELPLLERERSIQQPSPPSHHPSTLLEKIIGVTLFLLYASYFELTTATLTLFQPCDAQNYMIAYPWIKCHTYDHQYLVLMILGGIFATLYVLGIPLLFGWLLYRYRRVIHSPEHEKVEHWLGFLYECYRRKVYWFELVWILRRLLLAASISVLSRYTALSSASVLAILLISVIIQVKAKPFRDSKENTLELLSLVTLIFGFSIGQVMPSSSWQSVLLQVIFLSCFGVLALVYLGLLVFSSLLWRQTWQKVKSTVKQLLKHD